MRIVCNEQFLFAGSDSGSERAALYTLIDTVKLNGLDPETYV
ncbi:MAG: transposase domain-containing protein [Candidatus Competibacteraceae bacterium]|nr:transposase domain-containing protein [Candidatus Competibacteraceae bacterium]